MSNKTDSYAANYQILEDINRKLQSGQHDPNLLDELAPMLEKASQSYKICKERIEAAEKFVKDFENQEQNSPDNKDPAK